MSRNSSPKTITKEMSVWLGKEAFKRGWNDFRAGTWDANYERKDAPHWYERGRLLAATAAGVFGADLPRAKAGRQLETFMGRHAHAIWDEAHYDLRGR